jgi:hypothetical protein
MMLAFQRVYLITLLFSVCCSYGKDADVELNLLEEKPTKVFEVTLYTHFKRHEPFFLIIFILNSRALS